MSFLTVMEAGRPKIKALAHLVPGETSLPGLRAFFLCLHMKEKEGTSSLVARLTRTPILWDQGPTLMLSPIPGSLPKTPGTNTLVPQVPTYALRRDTNIQPTTTST